MAINLPIFDFDSPRGKEPLELDVIPSFWKEGLGIEEVIQHDGQLFIRSKMQIWLFNPERCRFEAVTFKTP